MSRGKRIDKPVAKPQPEPPADRPIVVQFCPRPRLFVALCVLFALWVGLLLTLYFTTVYHH